MRIAPVLLVACLSAACVRATTNPATGKTDIDIESPTKQGEDWSGKLQGSAMYPNVTGTAKALVSEGKTTVSVSLSGATPGGVHPWHVHLGRCGSGGQVYGDHSAYTPLQVGAAGRAEGNATINPQLDESKDYYVNIHASPSDMATIIACGDLDD